MATTKVQHRPCISKIACDGSDTTSPKGICSECQKRAIRRAADLREYNRIQKLLAEASGVSRRTRAAQQEVR